MAWIKEVSTLRIYIHMYMYAPQICHSNSLVESLNSEDEAAVSTVTQTGLTSSVSLEDPNVQQLLLEAYGNIGEPDSLYGVCASKTVSKETWMKLYEQEGDWEKSLSQ